LEPAFTYHLVGDHHTKCGAGFCTAIDLFWFFFFVIRGPLANISLKFLASFPSTFSTKISNSPGRGGTSVVYRRGLDGVQVRFIVAEEEVGKQGRARVVLSKGFR